MKNLDYLSRWCSLFAKFNNQRAKRKTRQPIRPEPNLTIWQKLIREFLLCALRYAFSCPQGYYFQKPRLGCIQIIEVSSEKDADWDREWNSRDWKIVWSMPFKGVTIEFDIAIYNELYAYVKANKPAYLWEAGDVRLKLLE